MPEAPGPEGEGGRAPGPEGPRYERPILPFERGRNPGLRWAAWSAVGFEFGLLVVLFFLGGRALDAKVGTAPWLTAFGTLLGVAAGTWLLIRTAVRAQGQGGRPRDPRNQDR
jgi:hypothetical protein